MRKNYAADDWFHNLLWKVDGGSLFGQDLYSPFQMEIFKNEFTVERGESAARLKGKFQGDHCGVGICGDDDGRLGKGLGKCSDKCQLTQTSVTSSLKMVGYGQWPQNFSDDLISDWDLALVEDVCGNLCKDIGMRKLAKAFKGVS
jgi:hypothetical protein